MKRTNYGIDAPFIIRNFLITSAIALIIGIVLYKIIFNQHPIYANALLVVAILVSGYCFLCAILMLWSSLFGKLRVRDKVIALLALTGNERVLDIGCGRGLLLIAVAKRLSGNGEAVGIDLWNPKDLSSNREEFTLENARSENVTDRVTIVSGDMTDMGFVDHSFDAVVSSMAIHNVSSQDCRAKAISEIARVLKPGGKIVIVDFQHTQEYKENLLNMGWSVVDLSKRNFWMFPPVRILTGEKPT